MKNNRFLKKPKLKKQISMSNFFDFVMEVAKGKGQNYISVKVTMNTDKQAKLEGYIHGCNWENGFTIDEVCKKLQTSTPFSKAPVSPVKEVLIGEDELV